MQDNPGNRPVKTESMSIDRVVTGCDQMGIALPEKIIFFVRIIIFSGLMGKTAGYRPAGINREPFSAEIRLVIANQARVSLNYLFWRINTG